ncbi:amidase family protein [Paenibacillus sp. NPDC058071]|uniref:amidase family protein n=1 Tax=Paenibacillus sp. NPDC058071 TaxID=3346326 RepID=UPI0036DCA453
MKKRSRNLKILVATLIPALLFGSVNLQPVSAQIPSTFIDKWTVNDTTAPPVLDTGSVKSTSNALMGYGGIRVHIAGSKNRMDGALLRGFGLTFDGIDTFTSTRSVVIDGVAVKRNLKLNQASNWGRFFDTFTNTTKQTIQVDVAFGGQLGYNTGKNQSAVASTSSGDTLINNEDSWVSFYTPSEGTGSASNNGPSATTIGTAGFDGSLDRTGNFLRNPFANKLAESGDEANHYGFVYKLVIPPNQTRSLAHFVVTGLSEVKAPSKDEPVPAARSQVSLVEATVAELAKSPEFSGLSTREICSLANYNPLAVPGFSASECGAANQSPLPGAASNPVVTPSIETTSLYDVNGKTITEMLSDMKTGKTTAQQITKAYLDRIAAYDQGPLGLNSVITVASDAMKQAREADEARSKGDKRPLLGIPILVKDIIDTKDMPTTGGSKLFKDYTPTKDAWQVAKLREAGAIILGKANLAEFAFDGHFSKSYFGPVWNAFDPSRSPIGSSGGSAVAVASNFAAAALGTQTGDSLWGPSGAASLVSLRGTDGMQSTDGTMPLTVVQDYTGLIARSLSDLALLLEATAVGSPNDPLDDVADGHRPSNWSSYLQADSLKGKVIGVPASAFNDPFGTTGTSDALRAQFKHFVAAGATIKEISDPPAAPARTFAGDTYYEGWRQWIESHPDNPYKKVEEIISSTYTGSGPMTKEALKAFQDYRANYRNLLENWMDDQGADVVLFPTELSDIHLNDSIQPSFGRRDPQSSASGVPTVIFPAGVNDHGQPIGFQLQGKAFSDADLLGYAYAFELRANGHVETTITPRLGLSTSVAALTDIKGNWAAQYISDLVAKGVMKGTSADKFSPNSKVTRGMFVTILGQLEKIGTADRVTGFKDVNEKSYYAPYIKWATNAGIVNGMGNGKFDPNHELSRQDAAVILNKYLKHKGLLPATTTGDTVFTDAAKVSPYAREAVTHMQGMGIMNGKANGLFAPADGILRSEVTKMITVVMDLSV